MKQVTITKAQESVLNMLKGGYRVNGRYSRSVRALEKAGLITNVKCIQVTESNPNYAKDYYEADVVNVELKAA